MGTVFVHLYNLWSKRANHECYYKFLITIILNANITLTILVSKSLISTDIKTAKIFKLDAI